MGDEGSGVGGNVCGGVEVVGRTTRTVYVEKIKIKKIKKKEMCVCGGV
jgi:hypothetical protein